MLDERQVSLADTYPSREFFLLYLYLLKLAEFASTPTSFQSIDLLERMIPLEPQMSLKVIQTMSSDISA